MKYIFFLLTILFLLSGCFKKDATNSWNELAYFKEKNEKRYESYQETHPNLEKDLVVARVNLGLDSPFYTNTKQADHLDSVTVLVNKYRYLPKNYTPKHLEVIRKEFNVDQKVLMKEAKEAFEELCEEALKGDLHIRAISTYRSFSYQENLYQKYVDQDGVIMADTYSARPGYSEHQTGLTVDVDNVKTSYTNFESTKEFEWMQQHSFEFGFILRYPKGKEEITGYDYESWHYRYVGKETAKDVTKRNLTYDEYYMMFFDQKK